MRKLGSSGLETSVIGMGTWRTFDVPLSDQAAIDVRREIVTEAITQGVDLFDSSPMYGCAEAVLGRALDGRRPSVLVATKVWSRSIFDGKVQIEQALSYYGGYVDIYQVHNLVQWQQYLPHLQELQESGAVRAVGVTHYAHSAFPELRSIMEREQIQVVQIPYNAADRDAERELLPLAAQQDIGVIVMSPLGSGDLVRRSPSPSDLQPLQEFGVTTWAQALLKWVVSDPRVSVVIPATSKPGRMTENARAGNPPFFDDSARERVSWLATRL